MMKMEIFKEYLDGIPESCIEHEKLETLFEYLSNGKYTHFSLSELSFQSKIELSLLRSLFLNCHFMFDWIKLYYSIFCDCGDFNSYLEITGKGGYAFFCPDCDKEILLTYSFLADNFSTIELVRY